MSPFPLQCWDPVRFGYLHAASLSEFICVPSLLCLEGFNPLVSSILSSFYTLSASSSAKFTEPQVEGIGGVIPLIETTHLRLSVLCLTLSVYCLAMGLCICSHLSRSFSDDN